MGLRGWWSQSIATANSVIILEYPIRDIAFLDAVAFRTFVEELFSELSNVPHDCSNRTGSRKFDRETIFDPVMLRLST